MSEPFEAWIPPQRQSCPSDLQLDQLQLQELSDALRPGVEKHLEGCGFCAERWRLRAEGAAAFPALQLDQVIDQLHAQTDVRPISSAPKKRRVIVGAIGAAAASLLAALILWPSPPPRIMTKGAMKLRVYKEVQGVGQEILSGAPLRRGDRIRFEITPAPRDSAHPQVMIVSLEPPQKLSVFYPSSGQHSELPAQKSGALPGSIELDDYLGEEWLYLIACDRPFALTALNAKTLRAPPQGCLTDRFLLNKVRSP